MILLIGLFIFIYSPLSQAQFVLVETSAQGRLFEKDPSLQSQPRKFRFVLDKNIPLQCSTETVFSFNIPTFGKTIAKLSAKIQHLRPEGDTHYWSLAVHPGQTEYGYSIGDDLCPNYGPFRKVNIGIGQLSETKNSVIIRGRNGSSFCSNGTLWVKNRSYVDVYVYEPSLTQPSPILYSSWMKNHGTSAYFEWNTTARTIVKKTIVVTQPGKYRVLATLEGTPHNNPNKVCGQEAATLMSRIILNDKPLSSTSGQVNASPSMGHLVRFFDTPVTLPAGTHNFELQVGANFYGRVTTGGCCGDGIIAIIPDK